MDHTIYFIRHGETTGDVEDRYGGKYDDELSPHGQEQAAAMAQELKSRGITRIVASPLLRARQTAAVLAGAIGASVEVIEGMRERDQYGPLSGMTKAEAKARHPDWVELLKDKFNTLPGAEPYEASRTRIEAAVAGLLNREGTTAVVWHGGPMRILFRHILAHGELAHIGDCAWVEVTFTNGQAILGPSQRLEHVPA